MSKGSVIFMLASWTFVLGLTAWSFHRLLTHKEHHDPDGLGPQSPPVKARTEK